MTQSNAYPYHDLYQNLVYKVRHLAPPNVTEAWGVVKFQGIADFRLNYSNYRVIELSPLPTRVAVFMEWRKIFRQPEFYGDDPDYLSFEDAFGYLGVNQNWNQPWNVYTGTDLEDPYVDSFLENGMKLMVKEIKKQHPPANFDR